MFTKQIFLVAFYTLSRLSVSRAQISLCEGKDVAVIEEEVELFNIECFSGGESLIEWNTDALLYLQTVAIAYICYTDPKHLQNVDRYVNLDIRLEDSVRITTNESHCLITGCSFFVHGRGKSYTWIPGESCTFPNEADAEDNELVSSSIFIAPKTFPSYRSTTAPSYLSTNAWFHTKKQSITTAQAFTSMKFNSPTTSTSPKENVPNVTLMTFLLVAVIPALIVVMLCVGFVLLVFSWRKGLIRIRSKKCPDGIEAEVIPIEIFNVYGSAASVKTLLDPFEIIATPAYSENKRDHNLEKVSMNMSLSEKISLSESSPTSTGSFIMPEEEAKNDEVSVIENTRSNDNLSQSSALTNSLNTAQTPMSSQNDEGYVPSPFPLNDDYIDKLRNIAQTPMLSQNDEGYVPGPLPSIDDYIDTLTPSYNDNEHQLACSQSSVPDYITPMS